MNGAEQRSSTDRTVKPPSSPPCHRQCPLALYFATAICPSQHDVYAPRTRTAFAALATTLCIDEAHKLKNPTSILYRAAARFPRTATRVLVTGTPFQNSVLDLCALVRASRPQDPSLLPPRPVLALLFDTCVRGLQALGSAAASARARRRAGLLQERLRTAGVLIARPALALAPRLGPLTTVTMFLRPTAVQHALYCELLRVACFSVDARTKGKRRKAKERMQKSSVDTATATAAAAAAAVADATAMRSASANAGASVKGRVKSEVKSEADGAVLLSDDGDGDDSDVILFDSSDDDVANNNNKSKAPVTQSQNSNKNDNNNNNNNPWTTSGVTEGSGAADNAKNRDGDDDELPMRHGSTNALALYAMSAMLGFHPNVYIRSLLMADMPLPPGWPHPSDGRRKLPTRPNFSSPPGQATPSSFTDGSDEADQAELSLLDGDWRGTPLHSQPLTPLSQPFADPACAVCIPTLAAAREGSKLWALLCLLETAAAAGDRVIVCSRWQGVLHATADALALRNSAVAAVLRQQGRSAAPPPPPPGVDVLGVNATNSSSSSARASASNANASASGGRIDVSTPLASAAAAAAAAAAAVCPVSEAPPVAALGPTPTPESASEYEFVLASAVRNMTKTRTANSAVREA